MVHWIWDDSGFMSPTNPRTILSGVIDFAGDGAIHMVGGFAALVGAWLLGPRAGRFDQGSETPQEFEAHSIPLVVLGTLILWFGWYGAPLAMRRRALYGHSLLPRGHSRRG